MEEHLENNPPAIYFAVDLRYIPEIYPKRIV